jgi:hypothetical protein
MDLPFDIQDAPRSVQKEYLELVAKGNSPRFAEMLALQQPPGVKGTDRAFMEGRLNNQQFNDMPPIQARYVKKAAESAGVSVAGKYYCAGIADSRRWRDPEAGVSGVDDVKRVAAKRRLHVTGSIEYTPPPSAPPQRISLAEDIIKDEMKRYKKANPKAKDGELREQIIEKHAYKPKVKTL